MSLTRIMLSCDSSNSASPIDLLEGLRVAAGEEAVRLVDPLGRLQEALAIRVLAQFREDGAHVRGDR